MRLYGGRVMVMFRGRVCVRGRPVLRRSANGQRVRLSVEHPVVEPDGGVVCEEEVQVFERLGQEVRLLHVVARAAAGRVHVANARVAGLRPAHVLQCLRTNYRSK